MKNGEKFNEILNECLESIKRGEPLETCLEKHPELASQLRPLLETALVARKFRGLQPRSQFREELRRRLRSASVTQPVEKRVGHFRLRLSFATAVMLALVLLVSSIGTVAVAGYSMPDQPLYPVKIALEQTKLALVSSPVRKAAVHLELADVRIDEIVYLAAKGKPQHVDTVSQRLKEHLEMVAVLTGGEAGEAMPLPSPVPPVGTPPTTRRLQDREQLKILLQEKAQKNAERLKEVLDRVPPSVRPNLDRTISQTSIAYQRALQGIPRPPEAMERRKIANKDHPILTPGTKIPLLPDGDTTTGNHQRKE